MSRRQAREIALQSLFQLDFNECEVDSAIENVLSHKYEVIIKPPKKRQRL